MNPDHFLSGVRLNDLLIQQNVQTSYFVVIDRPMPTSLHHFIATYGYLAVFLLVFLQEIGVPTIIPHEALLLLLGYLCLKGEFDLTKLCLLVIAGDLTATTLLYVLFYYLGSLIRQCVPAWLPLPYRKLAALKGRMSKSGNRIILIGRLTPFLRAYTSIAAGLLKVRGRIFLAAALTSSVVYSGGLLMAGWMLASCFHFHA